MGGEGLAAARGVGPDHIVEVVTRVPHVATRVTVSIDVHPGAEARAGAGAEHLGGHGGAPIVPAEPAGGQWRE